MAEDLLSREERDALRESIQTTARGRERPRPQAPEAIPVALIADDLATEKVTPAALRLAERWAGNIERLVPPTCGAKVHVELDREVVKDSKLISAEITGNWLGLVRPAQDRGSVLVAATGSMIPELAARVLGGTYGGDPDRTPTAATMRVFGKVGQQIVIGLINAMQQEHGTEVLQKRPPASPEAWQPIIDGASLISVRLKVTGDAEGEIRLVATPDTLAVARRGAKTQKASPALVRSVLGEVPVELSVDLGATTMSASDFADLAPGEVLRLDSLVGDPLSVRVGGRIHAVGHAVVLGDVVAVEIGTRD